jgi:predicted DNA-binding transcriptional regulator AlpA
MTIHLFSEQMEADVSNELYTVTQLAEFFGMSRQGIHNWINDGRFPNAVEAGEGRGKVVLVPAPDVEVVRKEEAEKLIQQLNRLGFQSVPA